MTLQKKIVISFLITSSVIGVLSLWAYVNFIEVRKEITFLELSDTLRSKTLQLRRHEKNFFLYADIRERALVHDYLSQITAILDARTSREGTGQIKSLDSNVSDYALLFRKIERNADMAKADLEALKALRPASRDFFPLIESTFLERPLVNAEFLRDVFRLAEHDRVIITLKELDTQIASLRRTGEEILLLSKDLDSDAKKKVELVLLISQAATLFLFPVFLIVGLGASMGIMRGVVRRLGILSAEVEKAGRGDFTHEALTVTAGGDEVEGLIAKFRSMEDQLSAREREIVQAKKLAAIGTFASGVAHELNNPLNNIYTTAQRLTRKSGDDMPPALRKGLEDIFSQTTRVKAIVADLLEFARGRDPHFSAIHLGQVIRAAYTHLENTSDLSRIRFLTALTPEEIVFSADAGQIEQLFINLFANAVDAMSGEGELAVLAHEEDDSVLISVRDTGAGMPAETIEKIFEPFFTTKDRGTGLGLAIVFSIVQKHSGSISAESGPGRGATFRIRIPKNLH